MAMLSGGVATSGLSIVIKAIDEASPVFSKISGNLAKTGDKFTSIGKKMTLGLTLPVMGIGTAATKMAADFSDATRYANTMMGATSEEMKNMEKNAISLAGQTGKSATEIMKSYYGIASAGYKGAEADKILKIATEGAVAGFIDQEKSVDALVKVMSIYDKSGEEASEVMDTMFGVVDKGLLTFDDLSTSFARASQFAMPLNIDVKEMGASLGFLSKKFSSTNEASSGLMGLTRAFIKPSEAMTEVTEKWAKSQGLAADTTTAQMVETLGLKGTLDLLQKTTKGNVDQMGRLIPEASGLTAALYLTSEEGAKELNDNLEYLNDSLGLTKEKFDEASESAKVQMAKSMEALKGEMIVLGGVLLQLVVPAFSKFTNWLTKLTDGQKKALVITAAVVAAMGPLLMIIGLIIKAIGIFAAVAKGLIVVFGLILTPIGVVVAAIALIGLAIYTVWKHWDEFKLGVKVAAEAIAKFFGFLAETIYDLTIGRIVNAFNLFMDIGRETFSFFTGFWEKLGEIFKSAADWIYDNSIGRLIEGFGKLKNVAGNVMDGISGIGEGIAGGAKRLFGFQHGGIVTSPTIARVGEGGAEAIIPLNKLGGVGAGNSSVINVYIQGGNYLDRDASEIFGKEIARTLRRDLRQYI